MEKVIHRIVKSDNGEYILRKFNGLVSTEDIMDSFVYMLNNNMISTECKGILTDLRGVDMDFTLNTFKSLLIYMKSSPKLIGLKIAVVVDSSESIVFPMMASNEPGLFVQPFSTLGAAEDWINQ